MLDHLIYGMSVASTLQNALIAFVGCLIGTVIGVLPGLGPTGTIAILLPVVFSMPSTSAMIMLAVSAIGSFIAGTFSVIVLTFIGEPMARLSIRFGPAEFFSLMVFGLSTAPWRA
jgi:putative tricarboxylic transport membrane protein